jgi:hypothetical protein
MEKEVFNGLMFGFAWLIALILVLVSQYHPTPVTTPDLWVAVALIFLGINYSKK